MVSPKKKGAPAVDSLRELWRGADRTLLRAMRPGGGGLSSLLRLVAGGCVGRVFQSRRALSQNFWAPALETLAPHDRIHRGKTRAARASAPSLPDRERDLFPGDQFSLPGHAFPGER